MSCKYYSTFSQKKKKRLKRWHKGTGINVTRDLMGRIKKKSSPGCLKDKRINLSMDVEKNI